MITADEIARQLIDAKHKFFLEHGTYYKDVELDLRIYISRRALYEVRGAVTGQVSQLNYELFEHGTILGAKPYEVLSDDSDYVDVVVRRL